MKIFKYILAAAASAVLAALLFAVPVSGAAETGRCYLVAPEGDGLPHTEGTAVVPDGSTLFTVGSAERAKRTDEGAIAVELTEKGTPAGAEDRAGSLEVARVYVSQPIDLSWADTLALDFIFSPLEGSEIREATFAVALSAGGADSVKFSAAVVPDKPYTMVMDLSSFEKRSELTRISATLEWRSGGGDPGIFEIGRLLAVWGRDFAANEAAFSRSFSPLEGTLTAAGGKISVTPEDGAAKVRFEFEENGIADVSPGAVPIRYVCLSSASAAGTVAAEFTVSAGDGPERVISFPSRPVFSGGHTAAFRIEAEEIRSAAFTFKSSDGSPVEIRSVSISGAGERDTTLDEVGGAIECSSVDGTFRVEGRLKKSVAAKYVGERIGLFTAPALGGESVLLATGRAGSAFSFSVPGSALPHGGLENYFWVSVLSDSGEDIQVTEKKFVSTASASEGYATVFGLHGADPAGVFEAGVKRVVIDVDAEKLTGGGKDVAGGFAVRRDGETYYLKDEIVRRLDGETAFYAAAGVGVYLRIMLPDGKELFSSDGEADENALDLYLALVSFFCERYQNVASVVIPDLSPESGTNVWIRAQNEALLARLTYGAAAEVTDSIIVTVPVMRGDTAGRELFAALLSEALSRMGQISWSLMTDDEKPETLDVCISSARANGTASPSFSAILSTPSGLSSEEAAALFKGLCARARTSGSRAVFLSLADCADVDYTTLRPDPEEGEPFTSEAEAADLSDVKDITESRTLWDFTNSYSSGGWIAGIGADFCGTVPGDDGRVLRFTLGREESHGILLREIPGGVSFSQFPLVGFDFTVSSETGADISFLFGREDGRREYSVHVGPGSENRRIVCDLGDWAIGDPVKTMSVLIRSEGKTTVDISRISAHSRTATSSTPFAGVADRGSEESPPLFSGAKKAAVYAVAAVAAVTLILTAVFCVRSDKDAAARRVAVRKDSESGGKS